MTSPAMLQHMSLASAYLCQDCNSVGNCSSQCPACASRALLALSTVLDREPKARVAVERLEIVRPLTAAA